MRQVIYVDVLVILNLFISYFLLLSTILMSKEKAKRWRLLLGALLGGIYSLVVFLPEMGAFFNILSRILAGGAIVFVSFGFKTYKRFLKLFVMFVMMTFLFAGLMIALWIIFKPNGMFLNNSTVYFQISLPVLVVSTTVCYVVARLVSKLLLKNKPQSTIYDFTLEIFGKKLSGRAMLDTGNTLVESFSGYPVVICTYEFLKDAFPQNSEAFFKGDVNFLNQITDENWRRKTRVVSFQTVSDTGLLPAFQPDKLSLHNSIETDKVYVAVMSRKKYINESFDMLLNPNLF